MVDKVAVPTNQRVGGASLSPGHGATWRQTTPKGASFEEVLRGKLAEQPQPSGRLRFSAHAQQRLRSREIELDGSGVARLEQAVDRAGRKGARESLVLMDDLALLVSVTNRVVVTAVQQSSAKDNVFTNIDSVVIA